MAATSPDPAAFALFSLETGRPFGEAVAQALGVALAPHEEREFEHGQHKTRPLESVRGRDVFVVQSLHGEPGMSANDKLCRLLFFIGALRDAAAARVTAVVPFLCYARKDRRTKPRDPVTTRYVAQLFEAVGAHRVVVMDVHNPAAFQNAFRCNTEHLETRKLLADHLEPRARERELVVVSPDPGGSKRADALRRTLSARVGRDLPLTVIEKHRSQDVVQAGGVSVDLTGRDAVIVDDMISSGTTLVSAARACRVGGAAAVVAAASHGVFTDAAGEALVDDALEEVAVLDTIPPIPLEPPAAARKLVRLPAAPFVAEAVRRLHLGGSLTELMGP